MRLPVGLFGVQRKITFVRSVTFDSIAGTSKSCSSVMGTSTGMPPDTRVRASYIENVGTLSSTSSPGATKVRITRSMISVEPEPSTTFASPSCSRSPSLRLSSRPLLG
jgi:hypothetical protein